MLLVDVFDVYDKVKQGLVEKKHLDMRVHMLRTGILSRPRVVGYGSSGRTLEMMNL
jgi:hypothetical protein